MSEAWRARLYDLLPGQARPIVVFPDGAISAAALWSGMRAWTERLRRSGYQAGDRIAVSLAPGANFLWILLSCLWEGLSLALIDPAEPAPAERVRELDAALWIGPASVGPSERAGLRGASYLPVTPDEIPEQAPPPGTVRLKRTPELRLLLRTSGSLNRARWIPLSDENLTANLDSHRPVLGFEDARLVSALPWRHAFGLLIELLPALFSRATIWRDPAGGRDTEHLLAALVAHSATHLCGPPLLFERLAAHPAGPAILAGLAGGVIGGAMLAPQLAAALAGTRLRVGYGQTEAAPGICLGAPGDLEAGYLGAPLGCQTRISADGELEFSGANACFAAWSEDRGLLPLERNRWARTGDLVRVNNGRLYYSGRADGALKLPNGRWLGLEELEARIYSALPLAREARALCVDGRSIELWLPLESGVALEGEESRRRLAEALGPARAVFLGVRRAPRAEFYYTPKGELDRRRMAAELRSRAAAESGLD